MLRLMTLWASLAPAMAKTWPATYSCLTSPRSSVARYSSAVMLKSLAGSDNCAPSLPGAVSLTQRGSARKERLRSTARALRRSPATLARLTALPRKRAENSSWVNSAISASRGAFNPGRGSKRGSAVGVEKRDQGQTSWQMSQPKIQFSRRSPITSGSSSPRSSIVP